MARTRHTLAPRRTALSAVPMPSGSALALTLDGRPSIALSSDDSMIWVGVRKDWSKPILAFAAVFALGYVGAEVLGLLNRREK